MDRRVFLQGLALGAVGMRGLAPRRSVAESGHRLEFATEAAEIYAHTTTLHGGLSSLDPEQDAKGPTPLIGDLSCDDGAVVGYSDGSVRFLDREELGLGPDDPIVAGPRSKSPILRRLSSD